MKPNKVVLMVIAFIIVILVITIKENVVINPLLAYSKEYIIGEGNIKGEVDIKFFEDKSKDFAIGANSYGYAVFKNPGKAFTRLKKDYKTGIDLIQREFDLKPLSNKNYELYGLYGWQVETGSEEEKRQARFVTSFFDIYENSYRKTGEI